MGPWMGLTVGRQMPIPSTDEIPWIHFGWIFGIICKGLALHPERNVCITMESHKHNSHLENCAPSQSLTPSQLCTVAASFAAAHLRDSEFPAAINSEAYPLMEFWGTPRYSTHIPKWSPDKPWIVLIWALFCFLSLWSMGAICFRRNREVFGRDVFLDTGFCCNLSQIARCKCGIYEDHNDSRCGC